MSSYCMHLLHIVDIKYMTFSIAEEGFEQLLTLNCEEDVERLLLSWKVPNDIIQECKCFLPLIHPILFI